MNDPMLPLPGLSPVSGKTVVAKFDGGLLSSDGGVLLLREVERHLRVADRLAACMVDPRAADLITHSLADILRFRLLMIAAGYEDGNDASSLRSDPMFKMALDLSPSDRELCSQSTISRLENLPKRPHLAAHGPRHGRSLLRVLPQGSQADHARHRRHIRRGSWRPAIAAVQRALRRIWLSADRRVRRRGPLHHRRAPPRQTAGGKEIKAFLRRLLRAIRANWPKTEILLRGDSHYCCPEVLDWCRSNGLDFILGVAPTSTLRQHIVDLEANAKACFEAAPKDGKVRRFTEFLDGAASWSRVERIIARVEAGVDGPDTRFVVTNLKRRNPRALYEDALLPARTGRKPHQILEDASGGGSHLLHQGHGQSAPVVPSRRRLLDHVGSARLDAQAFDVACRAVRHLAPAAHQARRARRRNEDDDQDLSADIVSGSRHLAPRAEPHPAPRHLSDGA